MSESFRSLAIVFFGCLFLLLLLQIFFRSAWFQEELESQVRVLVQKHLDMTVEWQRVEVHPLSLSVVLTEFKAFSGQEAVGTPFVQAPLVTGEISLLELFQQKLSIEEVRVYKPFFLFANSEGDWVNFLNIDKIDELASGQKKSPLQSRWKVIMRKLRIEDGQVDFVVDMIDLRTRLRGFTVEAWFDRLAEEDIIPIRLLSGQGLYRMFGRDFQISDAEGELAVEIVDGPWVDLVIDRVRLRGGYPNALVTASGRIVDLARRHLFRVKAQGETEINFLNDIFFDTPALTGSATFDASYDGDFEDFVVAGKLSSPAFAASDITLTNAEITARVTLDGLSIEQSSFHLLGGTASLGGYLAFDDLAWNADLQWGMIDTTRLQSLVDSPVALKGRAGGSFNGAGDLQNVLNFAGNLNLTTPDFSLSWGEKNDRRSIKVEDGELSAFLSSSKEGLVVRNGNFHSRRESLQLSGVVDWESAGIDMDVAVQSGDFSVLEAVTGFPIAGWGTADGKWMGTLPEPIFRFEVEARDVRLPWVNLDEASGGLAVDLHSIAFTRLEAASAGGRATMAAGYVGPFDGDTRILLPVRAENVALGEALNPLMGDVIPLDGRFTGLFELDSPIESISGFAQGTVQNLSVYGETIAEVDGRLDIRNGVLVFSYINGIDGAAKFSARGSIEPGGEIDFFVLGSDIDVSKLNHVEGIDIAGTGEARLSVFAQTQGPVNLSAEARVADLKLFGISLGATEGSLEKKGDLLEVEAVAPQARAEMQVLLEEGYPAAISALADNLNLSSLLTGIAQEPLGLRLDGTAELKAKLNDLKNSLTGSLLLSRVRLAHNLTTVQNSEPAKIELRDAHAFLAPTSFRGDDTRFLLEGSVGFDGDLLLDVNGGLNLKIFRAFIPRLAGADGVLMIDGVIRGTAQTPVVEASLETRDARFQLEGVNLTFHDVAASGSFRKGQILFDRVDARVGDGRMSGGGYLLMNGFVPTYVSLFATLNEAESRIPEWLLVRVNGRIEMIGPIDNVLLRGDLDIVRALYDDPMSWESLILRFRDAGPTLAGSDGEGLRLDLGLHSAGSIFVRNNLVDVKLRGDLRLRGYVPNVDVSGNLQFVEGSVVFRENVFEVESGQVNFLEGGGIKPYLDLQAQTRIEEAVTHRFHEIRLLAGGPPDDMRIELESSPPLPREDILSLLYIRRRASEGLGGGATPAAEAVSLAFKLNEELAGFQSEIRQYFGFEELVLEPAFTESSGSGTMKLRATKVINRELTATVSTSLTSNDLAFRLGYAVTDNFFFDLGWNSVPEQQVRNKAGRFGNFGIRPRLHFEFE